MKKSVKKTAAVFFAVAAIVTIAALFAACGGVTEKPAQPGGDVPDDVTVVELTVSDPPNVTEYYIGETFDPTGMKVKAKWSDGVKLPVNISDCTIDPSGPLSAGDYEVRISYGGKTAVQPITIKDDSVSSISVDTGNTALRAAVGTVINLSGISVTAHYADGSSRPITSGYTFEADGERVTDTSALSFSEWGKHTLTVVYGSARADIELFIFDGIVIEGENIIHSGETTTQKNYVQQTGGYRNANPKDATAGSGASGGKFLGDVFNTTALRFHVYVESDCYADVILRAAGLKLEKDSAPQAWRPLVMGDMQFNKTFVVKYGTAQEASAETLKTLNVADSVIIPGATSEVGDPILFENFTDINFGRLELKAGENIIELTVQSEYKNCYGEVVGCNIDRLEIQYSGGAGEGGGS